MLDVATGEKARRDLEEQKLMLLAEVEELQEAARTPRLDLDGDDDFGGHTGFAQSKLAVEVQRLSGRCERCGQPIDGAGMCADCKKVRAEEQQQA
ncbi:hypothetical protein [Streptomyces sp. NPDC001774]